MATKKFGEKVHQRSFLRIRSSKRFPSWLISFTLIGGYQSGNEMDDWFRAERIVKAKYNWTNKRLDLV